MSGKYFLDTNILLYTFDHTSKAKSRKADGLVQEALAAQEGVISYQVVQEFLNVALKKMPQLFKEADLKDYLKTVLWPLCAIYPDSNLFHAGLACHYDHCISFYDGLIIAAASKAGCKVLYSEDLQHGRTISGVKIQNPFL